MAVERHFSFVWYATVAGAAIATLPLGLLGWWAAWPVHAHGLALALFGGFLGAELSAPGVKAGLRGTMTAWMYSRVHDTFWRVAIGVWLSGIIMWRINLWLGLLFMAWLPIHYYRAGIAGPVDKAVRWLAAKLHIKVRTW